MSLQHLGTALSEMVECTLDKTAPVVWRAADACISGLDTLLGFYWSDENPVVLDDPFTLYACAPRH